VTNGTLPAPRLKDVTLGGGERWFYQAPEGSVFPKKNKKLQLSGHQIKVRSHGLLVISPSYSIPKPIEKALITLKLRLNGLRL
jgi:hypothetical protein